MLLTFLGEMRECVKHTQYKIRVDLDGKLRHCTKMDMKTTAFSLTDTHIFSRGKNDYEQQRLWALSE